MKRPQINYFEIDAGIRDLVHLLNEIPFIATESSCEGHCRNSTFVVVPSKQSTRRTAHGEKVFADKGCAFVDGGHIMFRCDKRYNSAEAFLSDLEELAKKYDFFGIRVCPSMQARYYLVRTDDVLAPPGKMAKPEANDISFDIYKTKVKQFWQVKIADGQNRLNEFKKAWRDVEEITKKYIPSQKSV